ncbi:ATP-binding protein [Leisingera sp. M658]|uniref:ATP-binding protein n=1 Tax=Leisingera sp. M658 TaxID=2867015 RepID=UPI0021A25DFD|nr:ATP-binding protein [Leisingera sp. M658]UWQ77369.1 ATP-binding protein [Leisingera sp. M658]
MQALGMAGGKFHFLNARGELIELAAGALSHRSNLVALMAGVKDPIRPLADIAPTKNEKRDTGFNAATAGDLLMQACGQRPLFNRNMPIRHVGTWRGSTGSPVVHLGENLLVNPAEERQGRMVAGALYPSVPAIDVPAKESASVEDIEFLAHRIGNYWNWRVKNAGLLVVAWIGQAVLGQYPDWRTHMYVSGKSGAGKTTLIKLITSLLGGMAVGGKNNSSAASIRQTTNRMALVRVFDEAEGDEQKLDVEEIIAMLRLMSGSEGAQMERGTSDHSGIRFGLYGAGLLGAIIPGGMAPQDRNRFAILTLGDRVGSSSPEDDAGLLAELEEDAIALGPKIWRRMLRLAPRRWDRTFRVYNGMVQGLGGRARDGDTIGTLLAGWDLMMFDDPLISLETDKACRDRLQQAREIAIPLLTETQEADEMGEGQQLLNAIFGAQLLKDHGGYTTVSEVIMVHNRGAHEPEDGEANLLERLGLRLIGRGDCRKELFISNAASPLLDKALTGGRWRKGAHKAALQTIDDVRVYPGTMRVAGRPQRGLVIPARLLPGYEESPEKGSYGDQ